MNSKCLKIHDMSCTCWLFLFIDKVTIVVQFVSYIDMSFLERHLYAVSSECGYLYL